MRLSYTPEVVGGVERTTPAPRAAPRAARFRPPPLACDSHFHIFGPHGRFPFAESRTFTPHDVPKERVMGLHDALGFHRGVIVQSACHGFDHAAVLDALSTASGRYKAVALLRPGIAAAELEALAVAGFCGARFHFLPHIGADPDFADIDALVARIRPLGWHTEIHVNGQALLRYRDQIRALDGPVVIDHIGRIDAADGEGEAFAVLRGLLDTGKVWIKLSGADRMTRRGWPFEDAVAIAAALARYAPERVLWGTDFPHPNIAGPMPDDGDLVDLIPLIAPDADIRRRMLVDNPAEVFGFPKA